MISSPQRVSALLVPREPTTPNWTATQDKALILFVRAHDGNRTAEFWRNAANATGRTCGGEGARLRWDKLCTMGIPYVTARPAGSGKRQKLIYAAVLADLKTMSRADAARKHGVTRRMIDYVAMIYGVKAKSLPKPCSQESADIALARQAWAEFEKTQSSKESLNGR